MSGIEEMLGSVGSFAGETIGGLGKMFGLAPTSTVSAGANFPSAGFSLGGRGTPWGGGYGDDAMRRFSILGGSIMQDPFQATLGGSTGMLGAGLDPGLATLSPSGGANASPYAMPPWLMPLMGIRHGIGATRDIQDIFGGGGEGRHMAHAVPPHLIPSSPVKVGMGGMSPMQRYAMLLRGR